MTIENNVQVARQSSQQQGIANPNAGQQHGQVRMPNRLLSAIRTQNGQPVANPNRLVPVHQRGGNPQLAGPMNQPPSRSAQNYASSLRRYHPKVARRKVQDRLRRTYAEQHQKSALKRMYKTRRGNISLGRKFLDRLFGVKAKGNAGVGSIANASGGRNQSLLLDLKLHRDRSKIVSEIQNYAAKGNQLSTNERVRLKEAVADLHTVLKLQKRELQILKDTRGMSAAQPQWEQSLDNELAKVKGVSDRLDELVPNEGPVSTQVIGSLVLSSRALFQSEPRRLANMSSPGAMRAAKGNMSSAAKKADVIRSKRNIMNHASMEHVFDYDANNPADVSKQQKAQQVNDAYWRKQFRMSSNRSIFTKPRQWEIYKNQRQECISNGMKRIEDRGLLGDFQAKLRNINQGANPGSPENPQINYRTKDGQHIQVSLKAFKDVMNEWRNDDVQYRHEQSEAKRGWFGRKFRAAGAYLGFIKTSSKAAAKLGEAVLKANEVEAETHESHGSESKLESEHAKHSDSNNEMNHEEHSTGETIVAGIDLVEHGLGVGAALSHVASANHERTEKKEWREQGHELQHQFDQAANIKQGVEKTKFEIRNAVKNQYGSRLSDISLAEQNVEIFAQSGQAARHGYQAALAGAHMFEKAISASAVAGGAGAAAVFEGVETILNSVKAGKAGYSIKQINKGADKFREAVADRCGVNPSKGKVTNEDLQTHLNRLEKTFNDNQEYLDDYDPATADDDDKDLHQLVTKSQVKLKEGIDQLKKDIKTLKETDALVQMMKDSKEHGKKTIIAIGSGIATSGYGLACAAAIVGGSLLPPVAIAAGAVAGLTAMGVGAYKVGSKQMKNFKANKAVDALLSRADPKVVQKLKAEAEQKGIPAHEHAYNYLAKQDPRWTASILQGQLKWESRFQRLTNEDITNLHGKTATQKQDMLDQHHDDILEASDTAKFLHNVVGLSKAEISAIVDADDNDVNDAYGAALIKQGLAKETDSEDAYGADAAKATN